MVEPQFQATDSCLTLASRSTTVKCWRSAERSLRERFLVMPACSKGASSSWMAARSVCRARPDALHMHQVMSLGFIACMCLKVYSALQTWRDQQQPLL